MWSFRRNGHGGEARATTVAAASGVELALTPFAKVAPPADGGGEPAGTLCRQLEAKMITPGPSKADDEGPGGDEPVPKARGM